MNYDLELFKKGKHYIKLETQEKYDEVMRWLEDNDITWRGGVWATHNNIWYEYYGNTAIRYNTMDNRIGFTDEEYFIECGYIELKERKMTNKDKILKAVENISDDKAKEILEFLGHKESKRFIPELNENYYYIFSAGDIAWNRYVGCSVDLDRLSQGNIFKTEEEAQFDSDKRAFNTKAYWEFVDNSDVIDWSDYRQEKYDVCVGRGGLEVNVYNHRNCQSQGTFYTTNEIWLAQWIRDNESNIKKFWFNQ